jgi:hypothetical protein
MGESAVGQAISQANRRLGMRREEDRGLKKEVLEIEKEMKKLATVWPDPGVHAKLL